MDLEGSRPFRLLCLNREYSWDVWKGPTFCGADGPCHMLAETATSLQVVSLGLAHGV